MSTLDRVCNEVRKAGRVTVEHYALLERAYGRRAKLALQALEEGRVKKYVFEPSQRVVWIVVGRSSDYYVMPATGFCYCPDFYFRIVDRKAKICYHVIAQRLAEACGRYEAIQESDNLYDVLLKEWKSSWRRASST